MIKTLDLHFLDSPTTIAAFVLETPEGPVLFETGPYSTFKYLEESLGQIGYTTDDIKHVFITHIHLDHAGAAWALAEKGANIYLHPFGEAHMHDPSKLIASASRIYGDDMDRLWGTLKGIDKNKLRVVSHEEIIQIGDQSIKAWHTPGHAVHHIAWQIEDNIIAGDVAGVRISNGPVVPPCPPPDINLEDWQASIALIRKINPQRIYLTHFGAIEKPNIDAHLQELEAQLSDWAQWILPYHEQGAKPADVTPLFQAYVKNQLMSKGLNETEVELYEKANPSWMSVAGLMRYWRKKNQ